MTQSITVTSHVHSQWEFKHVKQKSSVYFAVRGKSSPRVILQFELRDIWKYHCSKCIQLCPHITLSLWH